MPSLEMIASGILIQQYVPIFETGVYSHFGIYIIITILGVVRQFTKLLKFVIVFKVGF